MVEQVGSEAVSVSVRNLGGIESYQGTFEPGVTLLVGRNATNRSSLLRSVAAGLGGTYGELKMDADEGGVSLSIDGERYTRAFERRNGTVRTSGEPYSRDEAAVDLFSCLLETNPTRRAVERGDGDELRDVIMRPVDTEEIRSRTEATKREIRNVERRIGEIERRRDDLPALERQLQERTTELESVASELETVRERVDEYETDIDTAERAEAVVDELKETREEYENVRQNRRTQQLAVESLESERSDVRERFEETTASESAIDEREDELERLRRRERELATSINSLQSIVEFNEELAEGTADVPFADAGNPVDRLDPASETVECWTCGTTVEKREIANWLEELRAIVDEKRDERSDLSETIEERRTALDELREDLRTRKSLREELSDLEAELEERRTRIRTLEERETDLQRRIDELEARASESEELRDSDLLERYRRLSELEYERGQLEERVATLREEIDAVEALENEREQLRRQREELEDELASLRGRIEALETSAAETFNEHMATVLDLLDYGNIDRVWIERKTAEDGTTGGEYESESTFDLHIVRSTAEGAVYDDSIDHLSESEREVIGLVVALAGYLVHETYETVPVMLLDSLESIDSDRIAALVEYFAEYAPFLLVALLPEDAEALPDRYERVSMGRSDG